VTSSAPPARRDALIGTVLGKHVLLRLLGEGGMGAVYEAKHQDLGRRAAVKVLFERYARSSDQRLRFLREGQAASLVRHPNVVDVYDVGVDNEYPYLVMEYLEGEDLSAVIARERCLTVQRTADLLLPVVAAVSAAHQLGVVHRDLKPENIFLASTHGGIHPKVLDFGISKLVDVDNIESLTETGAFLGTPQYMSPEQAQGAKHIDHRSDQYSLGVILYQCVTGRRPVEEQSLYALIQRIIRAEFPPPSQLNPELPPELEAVILRAMAFDRNDRFPNTRALGQALLEFASARVSAPYANELSAEALAPTIAEQAAPSTEPPRLGTTLGESVSQRDLPRQPRPTRRWLAGAAIGAVALAALLARGWWSPVAPAVGSAATGSEGLASADVLPPAAVPSVRVETPPTAMSTGPVAASASAAAPATAAAVVPSAAAPAAGQLAAKPSARPKAPARPSLAPR
jgi:serine/threonine-protein kinase